MSETEHLHPPQEPDAPSAKWIAGLGLGTIGLTIVLSVIAAAVVGRFGRIYGGSVYPQAIVDPRPDRPEDFPIEFYPLARGEPGEGELLRQAGHERLNSWGWVDREAGTIHMPIDVAMDLVASAQETP